MPRKLKESDLSDKAARRRLKPGTHWRKLTPDIHLGYRKHQYAGGMWLVRWYKGNQQYWSREFAIVEGFQEADGVHVLNYEDASRWAVGITDGEKAKHIASLRGPVATVRSAVKDYLVELKKQQMEKGINRPDADGGALAKYVLSNEILASTALYELEVDQLRDWKKELAETPVKGGALRAASSVQKTTTYFKAALNMAAVEHRKSLPPDFQIRIKDGLGASRSFAPKARHGQILSAAETNLLLKAAEQIDLEEGMDGDLYHLTLLIAATGTRFSQIARVTVGDIQPHNSRVMIPVSFKGRGEKTITHVGFPLDAEVLAVLQPLAEGRGSTERLFERWYVKQSSYVDGKKTFERIRRGPWNTSSNYSRLWRKIVERAGLMGKSAEIVAYALRHTSIVRLLKLRFPVMYVAALHDTSEKSIRAHYAAEIVDAFTDLAAAAAFKISGDDPEPNKPKKTRLPKER